MKAPLAASTFALIVSLSGMTPAVANSSSTGTHSSSQLAPYEQGDEFTRSWDEQRMNRSWDRRQTTPSLSEDSRSFSDRSSTDKSCSLEPRFGFNDTSTFPAC